MIHVHESLNKYENFKFFSLLEEKYNQEKKEISPKDKEKEKRLQQKEKDGEEVIKKVDDNFSRFKSAAGNKIEMYRQFWDKEQKVLLNALKQKIATLKAAYKLFDSDYIVAAYLDDGLPCVAVFKTHLAEGEENPIFKINSKNIYDKFLDFYKNMINDFSEIKEYYVKHVEEKKHKEEEERKRKKLDTFLKES